jgi:hypothetical protein
MYGVILNFDGVRMRCSQRTRSCICVSSLLIILIFLLPASFGQTLSPQKEVLLKRKGELLRDIEGYEQKKAEAQATLDQAAMLRNQAESAGDSKNAAIASQAMGVARETLANAQRYAREDRQRLDAIERAIGQLNFNPSSGVSALVTARQPDIESLQDKIGRTQKILRQLIKSAGSDAAQREEWEKEAVEASGDAKLLSLNLTLDFIDAHIGNELKDANTELTNSVQTISSGVGADEPSRRAGLHTAFAMLKDRRDELERLQNEMKITRKTEEIRQHVEALDGKGNQSTLELIYHVMSSATEKLGPAKDLIDATYTIYREGASLGHLTSLNENANKYLEASKRLSEEMKRLVSVERNERMTEAAPK